MLEKKGAREKAWRKKGIEGRERGKLGDQKKPFEK